VTGPVVGLDEVQGLGVDGGLDHGGQGIAHDGLKMRALDARGHECQALHETAGLTLIGAHQEVGQLGDDAARQRGG
jgi:hypothetical protein